MLRLRPVLAPFAAAAKVEDEGIQSMQITLPVS